jgi:uncharacterized Fe-S cluster-containing radical SAM superfamily protein
MGDITKRIDAVTKIDEVRLQSGAIQPAPKSVKIELTARCNLRCKYCAVRTRTKQPKEDMDFYFFQKITEDMRMSGVEEIGLFYLGESFMNPTLLWDALKWCKQEMGFPYVFLTSNAVAAKPEVVRVLMRDGLDSLKWSVNGSDSKQFHEITGGSESLFWQALSNIKEAWDIRNDNQYGTTLSASSILYEGEQKDKMKETLDKYVIPFVDKHYWLPLYQMSMYADRIRKEIGYVPTHGNMGRIDESTMLPNRKPLPCWSAFTEGHVRVDGGLSACCFGSDERFDMGVLDGTNFMRQWNSDKFQALRTAQLKTLVEGENALENTVCKVCVAHDK